MTAECGLVATAFYSTLVEQVQPVSSPEVAEMAKVLENTFRFVNISFINELAQLCDRIELDVWEVVGAASSKPYAFMAHYPGPGVGGACIPIVPHFLSAVMADRGMDTTLISWATRVNRSMPAFIADKLTRLLEDRGALRHPGCGLTDVTVMLVGVTYKPNVDDMRGTPASALAWELRDRGAIVRCYDPFVPTWQPVPDDAQVCTPRSASTPATEDRAVVDGDGEFASGADLCWTLHSVPLDEASVRACDCAVIVTPHRGIDYDLLLENLPLVLDTRNACGGRQHAALVRL
jgi:UDP-N-acetyl-D-glucosamine dehydrogenase